MTPEIISIRENPGLLEKGVDYFASKWGIERRIYFDCISNSITTDSPLPRWYLLMKRDEIIGSYGLIMNDFISRQDLYPWLCGLFVEDKERGNEYGKEMLLHGRHEAALSGYNKLYLSTGHTGYYERYSWRHVATGFHPWGTESRIYESDTIVNKIITN